MTLAIEDRGMMRGLLLTPQHQRLAGSSKAATATAPSPKGKGSGKGKENGHKKDTGKEKRQFVALGPQMSMPDICLRPTHVFHTRYLCIGSVLTICVFHQQGHLIHV